MKMYHLSQDIEHGIRSTKDLEKPNKIDSFNYPPLKFAEERLFKLKKELNDSEETIRKYCNSLKDEIDICAESNIKSIQDTREKLISQVDDYEKSCLNENLSNNEKLFTFTDQSEQKYNQLKRKFSEQDQNEDEFKSIEENIKSLDGEIIKKLETVGNNVFSKSKMIFYRTPKLDDIGSLINDSTEYLIERLKTVSNTQIEYAVKYTRIKHSTVTMLPKEQNNKIVVLALYDQYNEIQMYERIGVFIKKQKVKAQRSSFGFIFACDNCLVTIFVASDFLSLLEIHWYTYDLAILKKKTVKTIETLNNKNHEFDSSKVVMFEKKFFVSGDFNILIYDSDFNLINCLDEEFCGRPLYDFSVGENVIVIYDSKYVKKINDKNGKSSLIMHAPNSARLYIIKSKLIVFHYNDTSVTVEDLHYSSKPSSFQLKCIKSIGSCYINESGDFIINDYENGYLHINDPL